MIKQVLSFTDFTFIAGFSSVVFFSVFISVLGFVIVKNSKSFKRHEEIPFDE